ncbi:GCN1 domain-containing protein [Cryptosporidium canis]|uniref:GCN1 domain-containing protein n=1 Tax=Cryptosporidium canis TaxID=195482 RepID=A0A9D5DLL9_9CRYT|nr:GCN1 domain-containing protein [Cryptosporidium canis]
MDAILSDEESCVEASSSEQDDPMISAIELIVQLSHAGIVSSILPRVVSGRMTVNKIRIIKSMSRIPSRSRLRSSLFDIVPKLIETSVDLDGNCDDLVRDLSREAMISIVQSLETQGMEAFVTILLDIIRQNTPSTNLSVSGRYQIESLKIRDLEELVQRRETLTRVRSIEFLTFSLFSSSPVYDTSFSMLIKYLVPLAMCDVSEDVRISASKAFHLFSISVPRKSVIQVCSVMRETIASLVHDPVDNSKHFAENKLVGSSWRILDGKVTRVVSGDGGPEAGGPSEQLLASSNKFIDSLTALYVQGISQGSPDSKEECATALREAIQLTNTESLRPIAVKLVGPLIRSISDRTTASLVRGALLSNLVIFLESCGAQLRPLLPQIQTILIKFLLDPNENVRRQCSQGIGFLSRLLGNRAEVLLGDLCSLAGKQSQSEESVKALLSSISLSLLSSGETIPAVSEALRNRLIGLALSMLEESKDATIRDTSGQILSSVLISYCQEEEIRDILTPLITATGDQDGDQPSRDRNLMNILNCCCESDGWRRLYCSLAGLEESVSPVFGDNEMDFCLSPENKERMFAGRPVPKQVLASPSWWIYKKTVVMLYKIMVDGSGGSQLKKLALGFLYNLTKTSIRDQDSFSASIVLQTLANLLEKDLLGLFPTFSDASLILDIQRICELIIESASSRDLFLQEIQSNLVCYSFGGACADAKTENTISHQDVLISLVSLPSIQSLNSKFPAVKLKAEQLLVFIVKLAAKLNKDGGQGHDQDQGYQSKFNFDLASHCDGEEPPSLFELVISDIIAVIQRMYPHLLSQQKINFTREYSRRVLAKASL